MSKNYNPALSDKQYMDLKITALQTELISYIDSKIRCLQNGQAQIIGLLQPPPAATERHADQAKTAPESLKWKMAMRKRVDALSKDYPELYADFNTVLRKIYRKMRDVYGIVMEQCAKDYRGGAGEGRTSYLEIISEDAKLRSIFEPILSNMEEDSRKEMERRRLAAEAEMGKSRQEIIHPLIKARGDKSTFGCSTYTTVHSRMRKNGVKFKDYAERYKRDNNLNRTVKNGELIDNIPELKREFARAVAELMTELKATG